MPLPAVLHRTGLAAYRRLPNRWRRLVSRAGTPNYTVGAVVVLRDGAGRVLLVRSRHQRAWALPGGLLRRREDPLRAAVREVREEIGLRLDPGQLRAADPPLVIDPEPQQVTAIFVAETVALPTADGLETLETEWFGPGELPKRLVRGTREAIDVAGSDTGTR
jgi:8-oxo-dGTP pyrophosphatase MutT (NUDIX family)